MADLDAASLDDVKQWFRDYYGTANTTLVLAGDITPAIAKEKAQKYFGDIPAGPPVPRQQAWIAPRTESTRGTQQDHVAQVRIYREWNVPQLGDAENPLLEIAASMLGGGKTSRLYQRLVYQDKLVDEVSVHVSTFALASLFELRADVKNGVDPAKVEAAIADEWAKFLKDGPTEDELLRAKTSIRANFIRGLEKVGGFGGKAVILAENQVYLGDPAAYKTELARAAAATPASVLAAARKWISKQRLHAHRAAGQARRRPRCRRQGGQGSCRCTRQAEAGIAGCEKVYSCKKCYRPQQGRTRSRPVPGPGFPRGATRQAQERHRSDPRRTAYDSDHSCAAAIRRRLCRRPWPQTRHCKLRRRNAR